MNNTTGIEATYPSMNVNYPNLDGIYQSMNGSYQTSNVSYPKNSVSFPSMEGSYPFTDLQYGMPQFNVSYIIWNNFAPENIGKRDAYPVRIGIDKQGEYWQKKVVFVMSAS